MFTYVNEIRGLYGSHYRIYFPPRFKTVTMENYFKVYKKKFAVFQIYLRTKRINGIYLNFIKLLNIIQLPTTE